MRKYTITIASLALIFTVANTNPEKLSAQGLMLTLIFVSLLTLYVLRNIAFVVMRRLGVVDKRRAQEEQVVDLRSLSLAVLAVIFLFFLNLAGSLSARDFVLAIVLSFLCHFYIERRIKQSA